MADKDENKAPAEDAVDNIGLAPAEGVTNPSSYQKRQAQIVTAKLRRQEQLEANLAAKKKAKIAAKQDAPETAEPTQEGQSVEKKKRKLRADR